MKPSLLMLPSAVSDSRVHNILPNKIDTDFQFSRASAATRVNHQGLIENVGYFSDELVQNGDFSELGSELVTDGDFSSSANWNTNDWFINNGKATLPITSTNNLNQNISITQNKTYKIVFTISNLSDGGIRIRLGIGSISSTITTNGTHTLYLQHTTTNNVLRIYANTSGVFNGEIDNVSVKQVDPDDDWVINGEWEYVDNGISITNATGGYSNSALYQLITLDSSKQYKATIDVSSISGSLQVYTGSFSAGFTVDTTGVKSFILDLTSVAGRVNILPNASTSAVIKSFSLVEVIGDKPRLDYDPTNPTCPHLLLEPQSTNLITFSENFNSSLYTKTNITVASDSIISPDGTKNASMLTDDSTNGTHRLTTSALFAADGNNRCWSIFVKKGTSRYCAFNHVGGFTSAVNTIVFDFDTATYTSVGTTAYIDEVFPPQNYGNGWYKISFRSDINSASYNRLNIGLSSGPNYNDASYAGTGDTMYVWGGQVEQQDYVTSYIPTAGTTITRVGETCTNAGNVNTFNSTEGVLYAEIAALADNLTFRSISINDGTNDEAVIVRFRTDSNRINGLIRDGGTARNNLNFDVTDIKDFHKVAYKFKTGDCALYIDGAQVASSTQAFTLSALTNISFYNTVGDFFYGKVKSLATYNRALTDNELYTITSTQYSAYSGMVAALGNYTIPC